MDSFYDQTVKLMFQNNHPHHPLAQAAKSAISSSSFLRAAEALDAIAGNLSAGTLGSLEAVAGEGPTLSSCLSSSSCSSASSSCSSSSSSTSCAKPIGFEMASEISRATSCCSAMSSIRLCT